MMQTIFHQTTQKVFLCQVVIDEFMMNQSSISMSKAGIIMQNRSKERNDSALQGGIPNDMDKIFSYMKNVLSNPSIMDQMEKFMTMKQTQKNSSFVHKHNQSLSISKTQRQMVQSNESNIYQYLIEPSQQSRPQPLKYDFQKETTVNSKKNGNTTGMSRKKGTDVLNTYTRDEEKYDIKNQNNKNQQNLITKNQKKTQKLINQQTTASFEDLPIKSNYIVNQQFNEFAQAPASYPQNQVITVAKNKNISIKFQPSFSPQPSNKYIEAQQRPIKGTNQDFKQLLKEKIQYQNSPFQNNNTLLQNFSSKNNQNVRGNFMNQDQGEQNQYEHESNQNENQKKPKKQFLKRGSRQYLSSAKDKKQVTKKPARQNLNNSRTELQRSQIRDKTPNKRDVSQNRVLSKRGTINNNDKSISKIKNQSGAYQNQKQNIEQNLQRRSITPRNERGINVKQKSPMLPPKNNKLNNNQTNSNVTNKPSVSVSGNGGSGRKKNVFDDQSSSQDNQRQKNCQDQTENFPQNKNKINALKTLKNNQNYQPQKQFDILSRQKKQQFIPGVFLTKTQLTAIIQKHGPKVSSKSSLQSSASQQKFNQLRKKYTDLCSLLQLQKSQHEQQMQKEKQQFQNYKQSEIQKLKNEKRVMERQLKSAMPSQGQNLQKDKQQIQNFKKQLEKQKQEHKKRQKNNKILIEKYKKQNQDLKYRVERLQEQLQKQKSNQNFSSKNSFQNQSKGQSKTKNLLLGDKTGVKSSRDISPVKSKSSNNKNVNSHTQQNEENDQVANQRNYKKTVPLIKGKGGLTPNINEKNDNIKKKVGSKNKFQNESQNSDQNLPTFKVDNGSHQSQDTKPKNQKKYQFVQNSSVASSNSQHHSRKSSVHQSKKSESSKNVFADDDSDENNQQNGQQNEKNDLQNEGQTEFKGNFFKPNPKFQNLSDLMSNSFSIKQVNPQLIDSLLKFENNLQHKKYLQKIASPKRILVNSSKNNVDKKITNIYSDKSKEILFQNGVKKQLFQDGYTIIYFKNGDIKQKLADGTILYYFLQKKVDQITLPNGMNIYRFDNNQVQLHYQGGKYIQIRHPDGTIKMLGSTIN